MWTLYILMSFLAAGVVIKTVHPLLGRGALRLPGAVSRADRLLAGTLMFVIPVVSLTLYLSAGRPDMKGQQAVFYNLEELSKRHLSLLAQRPMSILLEEDPNDLGALRTLGKIHTDLGNHAEAVKFFSHAVRSAVTQQDPFLRLYVVALGEAQILANNGKVGDDALATFQFVRTIYPESPLARHYIALRKRQDGDVEGAVQDWLVLLNEGPTRAYWKEKVRIALEESREILRRQRP